MQLVSYRSLYIDNVPSSELFFPKPGWNNISEGDQGTGKGKKSAWDLLERRKEAVSQHCKYILLQKSGSFHKPRQKAPFWLGEDQIWLSSELIAFTTAGRAPLPARLLSARKMACARSLDSSFEFRVWILDWIILVLPGTSQLLLLPTSRILAWGSEVLAGRKVSFTFIYLYMACGSVGMGGGFITEKVGNSTEFDGKGAIMWRQRGAHSTVIYKSTCCWVFPKPLLFLGALGFIQHTKWEEQLLNKLNGDKMQRKNVLWLS